MEYLPTALRMAGRFLWTTLQSLFIVFVIWYMAYAIVERL